MTPVSGGRLANHTPHARKGRVDLSGPVQPRHYGTSFPPTSPLRQRNDETLLQMKESAEYQTIKERWFGDAAD